MTKVRELKVALHCTCSVGIGGKCRATELNPGNIPGTVDGFAQGFCLLEGLVPPSRMRIVCLP